MTLSLITLARARVRALIAHFGKIPSAATPCLQTLYHLFTIGCAHKQGCGAPIRRPPMRARLLTTLCAPWVLCANPRPVHRAVVVYGHRAQNRWHSWDPLASLGKNA